MLTFTMKCQESIVVASPDDLTPLVTVTVCELSDQEVRLSFEDRSGVPVSRLKGRERMGPNGHPDGPTGGPAAPVAS